MRVKIYKIILELKKHVLIYKILSIFIPYITSVSCYYDFVYLFVTYWRRRDRLNIVPIYIFFRFSRTIAIEITFSNYSSWNLGIRVSKAYIGPYLHIYLYPILDYNHLYVRKIYLVGYLLNVKHTFSVVWTIRFNIHSNSIISFILKSPQKNICLSW